MCSSPFVFPDTNRWLIEIHDLLTSAENASTSEEQVFKFAKALNQFSLFEFLRAGEEAAVLVIQKQTSFLSRMAAAANLRIDVHSLMIEAEVNEARVKRLTGEYSDAYALLVGTLSATTDEDISNGKLLDITRSSSLKCPARLNDVHKILLELSKVSCKLGDTDRLRDVSQVLTALGYKPFAAISAEISLNLAYLSDAEDQIAREVQKYTCHIPIALKLAILNSRLDTGVLQRLLHRTPRCRSELQLLVETHDLLSEADAEYVGKGVILSILRDHAIRLGDYILIHCLNSKLGEPTSNMSVLPFDASYISLHPPRISPEVARSELYSKIQSAIGMQTEPMRG